MTDYIPEGNPRFNSIGSILGVALNFFMGVAISISMIGLLMSGVKFITSKGDFKAMDKAKQAFTYSIVAMVLAMAAYTVKRIILAALGSNSNIFSAPAPDF